ncbi:Probable M14 family peptidase [Tenacibaculum maritimum]|uniref:M14 family zinc carboxypeptidase n=1 Tax=Tenacibaculum maritimum TaxID=107401 RepID=UPI0012E6157C|nr:M14 family zinc carboxypeptidase [Tenacibaculum maritimum]CAA0151395.1 Probable M14 family peptidase [Tenacibaculum maritimum]
MTLLNVKKLQQDYLKIKESTLSGKWISFQDIKPLLANIASHFSSEKIGNSEKGVPIYKVSIGTGKKKILIWSQMHGNESTGTKAIFDLFNFLIQEQASVLVRKILEECTLEIIPMLNPDGSLAYTRVNSNGIDLNRDAVDLKAKESRLLRTILDRFSPIFCFNLHDQRTIFGVEGTKNPAAISFLAPSEEVTRKITQGRIATMNVIIAMNSFLQQIIPNHVGRYTDEFYPTATGDNFQKLGHNTILIEAGHYPNDYQREKVREYNFYALVQGIYHISIENKYHQYKEYFDIPNNQKVFFDVIHRNKNKKDVAFQYVETIENGTFVTALKKEKEGDLSNFLAHRDIIQKD